MATKQTSYAIIALGGKQYRVREGERLLVDRVPTAEGKTFQPDVLLVADNGSANLSPRTTVTAKVVGHVRGKKIRIGKYRPKSGYRRHTGFRSRLSQIEIESIAEARKSTRRRAAASAAGPSEPTVAEPATDETTES